jgi:hypothetical protein
MNFVINVIKYSLHIIVQRGFIVIFPYMNMMYFDQVHPSIAPLYHFLPLKIILTGFIIVILYVHKKYFNNIHILIYSCLSVCASINN